MNLLANFAQANFPLGMHLWKAAHTVTAYSGSFLHCGSYPLEWASGSSLDGRVYPFKLLEVHNPFSFSKGLLAEGCLFLAEVVNVVHVLKS